MPDACAAVRLSVSLSLGCGHTLTVWKSYSLPRPGDAQAASACARGDHCA